MQVYIIPTEKLNEWQGATFQPIEDANGNYVVAVNADYSEHTFNDELIKCEIIDYLQKEIEINETP